VLACSSLGLVTKVEERKYMMTFDETDLARFSFGGLDELKALIATSEYGSVLGTIIKE